MFVNRMNIYKRILECRSKRIKQFAVLIDPDKQSKKCLIDIVKKGHEAKIDFFFVGGSLIRKNNIDVCIDEIKRHSNIPVVLFPGSDMQISEKADGILFLSLISGRNADMIIGRQVVAAPILKNANIEILSTGYMLIDSGNMTTASYISNTRPIPHNKEDIAVCTAMAGEMLGMKIIYMDAGSGGKRPISKEMINTVAKDIDIPLIVGGGIDSPEKAELNCKAGADIIVVGNAIEKNNTLIKEISNAIHNR